MTDIRRNPFKFGQFYLSEGIFLGACTLTVNGWNPKHRESLLRISHQKYLVFLAGQDLVPEDGCSRSLSFAKAIEGIGRLNLYGHKGAIVDNEQSLFNGLENGKLVGLWVPPPMQVLCGHDCAGNYVQPNNIFRFKGVGALKETVVDDSRVGCTAYMSCATLGAKRGTAAWEPQKYCRAVDMHNGKIINLAAVTAYMRPEPMKMCRPVRFMPVAK